MSGYDSMPNPSERGGGGGSPNRSITTELTDLDSIQTLNIEDDEEVAASAAAASAHGRRGQQQQQHLDSRRDGRGYPSGASASSSSSRGYHHQGRQHGATSSSSSSRGGNGRPGSEGDAGDDEGGAGCLKGLRHIAAKKHGGHHQGRAPRLPREAGPPVPAHAPGGGFIFSRGADPNLVISGHQDLNTLYASNDVRTNPITVNVLNAPNSSTVQCGCENVNCPFCNLMLSIERTDPTVLQ